MPFDMSNSDAILTRDVTERGLRTGDVGTVGGVARRTRMDPEEGYSDEFFDMTGNTVAVANAACVYALRSLTPADRPAVRALSACSCPATATLVAGLLLTISNRAAALSEDLQAGRTIAPSV